MNVENFNNLQQFGVASQFDVEILMLSGYTCVMDAY